MQPQKTLYKAYDLSPLSANPTKWSNTLKQFVGNSIQGLIGVSGLM